MAKKRKLQKREIKILDIRNIRSKMNFLDGLINRQNIAWEIISELEHRSIEMIQTEIKRKMNKKKQCL